MKSLRMSMLWAGVLLVFPVGPGHAQEAEERAGERIAVEKGAPVPADDGLNLGLVAGDIVAQVNAFRDEHERGSLDENDALREAAESFAQYMAENDRYGHGADDRTPAARAEAHGYDYCIVLENIAYAYDSTGFDRDELALQFYEGWRDSRTHRENMLDPDVTETAVAIARSGETGVYYAVQLFGLPRSAEIEFVVVNRAGREIQYRLGEQTLTLPAGVTRRHTVCRPPEVAFPFADEQVERPADGVWYVVKEGAQGLQIERRRV